MKFGKRTKLASYLATWALVGIILLSIPTLISPFAERTLNNNPNTNTNIAPAANRTTSYRLYIPGSNNSSNTGTVTEINQFYSNGNNQTFTIFTSSATNITIQTLGNAHILIITSTAPANVTVTTRSPPASNAAPIVSNIPDFALRLSLILLPAVALSGLGMVRARRRFTRQSASDSESV